MTDTLTNLIIRIGGAAFAVFAIYIVGRSSGKKKADEKINQFKIVAEDQIRDAERRASEARLTVEKIRKEAELAKLTAEAVATKPEPVKVQIKQGTKDEILNSIEEIIRSAKERQQ